MANLKIRKGDRVRVLSGKDKGKEGEVMSVDPAANKAIVEGVNVAKRHQKPTRSMQQGGIIDKAMPIHVSNVALVDRRQADPRRLRTPRRQEGARIEAHGRSHQWLVQRKSSRA